MAFLPPAFSMLSKFSCTHNSCVLVLGSCADIHCRRTFSLIFIMELATEWLFDKNPEAFNHQLPIQVARRRNALLRSWICSSHPWSGRVAWPRYICPQYTREGGLKWEHNDISADLPGQSPADKWVKGMKGWWSYSARRRASSKATLVLRVDGKDLKFKFDSLSYLQPPYYDAVKV